MDAFEYIQTLPSASLDRLYQDPWACQAVFQALPALSKQFTLRLLCFDTPFESSLIARWVEPQHSPALDEALMAVRTMDICTLYVVVDDDIVDEEEKNCISG